MRHRACIAALGVLALVAGCSAKSSTDASATSSAKVSQPIPPNSPLAKVQIGMTTVQVQSILGAPTNQVTYESGKRWIPWYFGRAPHRMGVYKGLGRVVFTGGNQWGGGAGEVQRVDYNPNETGTRPN